MFDSLNRNKRSITVDLDKQAGKEFVHRLVRNAHVFLSNVLPATASKLGVDYESLRKLNPQLVYCHISAFGPKGPHAFLPGNDPVAQARSGICVAGSGAAPASQLGFADQAGAIASAYAILAALLVQQRTGVGQQIETSLLGSMLWLQATRVVIRVASGQEPVIKERTEVPNPLYNYYKARDGRWLWLGRWTDPDRYWPAWCRALGIEELQNDPRFSNLETRTKNSKVLISILDGIFAKRNADEWMEIFAKEKLLGTAVSSISDAIEDPQVLANNYVVECPHPDIGKMKVVLTPIQFEKTPVELRSTAPQMGQHTEEILTEVGYSWEEIGKLKDEKVIA